MVDHQTESLTHVDFDPATFEVSWLFEDILKMEWSVSSLKSYRVCIVVSQATNWLSNVTVVDGS